MEDGKMGNVIEHAKQELLFAGYKPIKEEEVAV